MEGLPSSLAPGRAAVRKIYILLPAYNEAPALAELVPNIVHHLRNSPCAFEILVVNDGSTDGTSRLLAGLSPEMSTRELRHDRNRGYGAALKTGFVWIAERANGEEAVVSMDADNTQDPAYVAALISKLDDGFDAVTASYTMPGGGSSGLPLLRRMMSAAVNRLFQWVIGIPGVETYTNGFRAYRVSGIQKAYQKYADRIITESGFPGGTEFFLKILGTGAKSTEIPFVLRYEHRGSGSKIHLLATIWRYLKLVAIGDRYARS